MNTSNLGQTSGDFPLSRKNLGGSGKSEIPNRPGFPRHLKTRLKLLANDTDLFVDIVNNFESLYLLKLMENEARLRFLLRYVCGVHRKVSQ